jgi:hypothetical protein
MFGKAVEMLIIRVAAAILFGALTLWPQASEKNCEQSAQVVDLLAEQPNSSEVNSSRLTLKLDLPHYLAPDPKRIFTLAESSVATFAIDPAQTSRPKTVTFSKGFYTRRKIHKYASYATLPLLAAEGVVGQKLLDRTDESDSLKSAHSALAAGIGVLFGVETLTGIWNMRNMPKAAPGHNKRFVHGVLMLAADVGFIATAATAPHREERNAQADFDASTHKAVAYTSLGVAAFSYLYMLFAK